MKLLITALLVMLGLGYIAEANETYAQELQPMYRSCDSKYLRHPESCWSNTTECPPGWDGQASYCWSRKQGKFYRCGTVCESIYRGSGGH
jgi:hypothetical protein